MSKLLENQEKNARDFDLNEKLISTRNLDGNILQPKKYNENDYQWVVEGKREVILSYNTSTYYLN